MPVDGGPGSPSPHGNTSQKLRLVLADDHDLVREGLRRIIENQDDMEVIGEARDGMEAVRLVTERRPDILLVDVSMPAMSGVDVTRTLRTSVPDTQAIAVTRHRESRYVTALLDAGACGYVLKQRPSSELLLAIRSVAAGTTYIYAALRPNESSASPGDALAARPATRPTRDDVEQRAPVREWRRSGVDRSEPSGEAPGDRSTGHPALSAKPTNRS